MRDLQKLEEMVHDGDSRMLLVESIKAYQVGANRAAIIQIWVTVFNDLINKMKQLSESDPTESFKTFLKNFDNNLRDGNVAGLQKAEREILKVSCSGELIDNRQKEELERIHRDRHLCAHPAFVSTWEIFNPSSELVRSHLAAAVDSCLSLPPRQGGSAVKYFREVISSKAWPKSCDLVVFLEEKFFSRSRDGVDKKIIEAVVDSLFQVGSQVENHSEVSREILSFRYREVVNALLHSKERDLYSAMERVIKKRRGNIYFDTSLLRLTGALGHVSKFWDLLRDSEIDQLEEMLSDESNEELLNSGVFFSGPPVGSPPSIVEAYGEAFEKVVHGDYSHLRLSPLEQLIKYCTYNQAYMVDYFLKLLDDSDTYRKAECHLSYVTLLADFMSAENLRSVFESIKTNSQLSGSYYVPQLVVKLFSETRSIQGAAGIFREGISEIIKGVYFMENEVGKKWEDALLRIAE